MNFNVDINYQFTIFYVMLRQVITYDFIYKLYSWFVDICADDVSLNSNYI